MGACMECWGILGAACLACKISHGRIFVRNQREIFSFVAMQKVGASLLRQLGEHHQHRGSSRNRLHFYDTLYALRSARAIDSEGA